MSSIKFSRPERFILVFLLLNLIWRGIFLPVSQSSYTDGILQINSFNYGLTYWPPLYAVMTRTLVWLPGIGLEGAARAVAWLMGALMVLPISAITRRLFGLRAAIWAMIIWTLSPMAMRWSLQVMTDIPMCFFWMSSQAMLVLAAEAFYPAHFPGHGQSRRDTRQCDQYLLLASLLGVMACLTRYQGLLLFPPVAFLTILTAIREGGRLPHKIIRCLWPWVIIIIWALLQFEPVLHHIAQISDRSSGHNWAQRFVLYFMTLEDFVLHFPYYATWGFSAFMIYGFSRTLWSTTRIRWALWLFLFLTGSILIIQSVFLSFQERYLLPLIPWVCIFGGHGFAILEKHRGISHARFWIFALPAILLAMTMSFLIAVYQGQPFRDLKDAATFVTGLELQPDVKFLSNEIYNEKIQCVKTGFWLNEPDVAYLHVNPFSNELAHPPLNGGDVIIFTSSSIKSPVWGRTPEYFFSRLRIIEDRLNAENLGLFRHRIIPVFPDLMQEGNTHQNPMAHGLRYIPQYFMTAVLRVREDEDPTRDPDPVFNRPPLMLPDDTLTSKVKTLKQDVEALGQKRNPLKKNKDFPNKQ